MKLRPRGGDLEGSVPFVPDERLAVSRVPRFYTLEASTEPSLVVYRPFSDEKIVVRKQFLARPPRPLRAGLRRSEFAQEDVDVFFRQVQEEVIGVPRVVGFRWWSEPERSEGERRSSESEVR